MCIFAIASVTDLMSGFTHTLFIQFYFYERDAPRCQNNGITSQVNLVKLAKLWDRFYDWSFTPALKLVPHHRTRPVRAGVTSCSQPPPSYSCTFPADQLSAPSLVSSPTLSSSMRLSRHPLYFYTLSFLGKKIIHDFCSLIVGFNER